jgi:hypothetical protein
MRWAYWVGSDTGIQQTTEHQRANLYPDARELAVLVPIPEVVLDDADFDIWGEIRPRLAEAMGAKIGAAALFGTDSPSGWPDSIVEQVVAKGNDARVEGCLQVSHGPQGTGSHGLPTEGAPVEQVQRQRPGDVVAAGAQGLVGRDPSACCQIPNGPVMASRCCRRAGGSARSGMRGRQHPGRGESGPGVGCGPCDSLEDQAVGLGHFPQTIPRLWA